MPAAYLAPQSAIGGIGPGLRDAVAGFREVTGADEDRQKAAYVGQQLKDQAEAQQIKMKQIRAEESERVEKEQIGNKQHNLISVLQDQGLSKPSIDMLAKRLKEQGVTTEDPSVSGGAPFVKTKHLGASLKDAHDDIVFNTKIEKNELDDTNAKIADLKQSIQDKKVKDLDAANKQLKAWEDKATNHANTIFQMKSKIEQNAIAADHALLHLAGGDQSGIDADTGQLNKVGQAQVKEFASKPENKKYMSLYSHDRDTGNADLPKALHEELKEQAKMPLELAKEKAKSADQAAKDKAAMERTKVHAAAVRYAKDAGIKEKSKQANFADYFEALKDKNPDVTYDEAFKQYSKDKKAGGKPDKVGDAIDAAKKAKDQKVKIPMKVEIPQGAKPMFNQDTGEEGYQLNGQNYNSQGKAV